MKQNLSYNSMNTLTPPPQKGVLSKSIESGKWLMLGQIIQKILGILSFFIIARLLTPADFGFMAIVLLIPNLLNAVTETGFATAALQRGGNIYSYLDPIWTIGIIKAILIALATFLAGPFIANYLHATQAVTAIRLGGMLIILYSLVNIGEIFFFKDLDLKKIFIRNLSRDIAYIITAVVGALLYHSYWALVVATMVSYIVQTASTYILHPYRPKLSFNFYRLRDLVAYSRWIVVQGWLDQIYGFIEQAIVARTTNATSMGLYSKSKNLASAAPGLVSPLLNIVGFATYIKIKESETKLRDGFVKSLHILFFVLIPITILFFFAGGKLILIFLGTQWLPMTNTLRVFLLFYLFMSIIDLSYTLLNAVGYPDKKVKQDAFKISFTTVLMLYLSPAYGIIGTALAMLCGLIPIFIMTARQIVNLTSVTYRDFIGSFITPFLLSLALLAPAVFFHAQLLQQPAITLVLMMGGVAVLYCLGIVVIGKYWRWGPYPTIKLIIAHLK